MSVRADVTFVVTGSIGNWNVQFTDLSTGSPNSWSWQFFGPGSTGDPDTSQNPLRTWTGLDFPTGAILTVSDGTTTDMVQRAIWTNKVNIPDLDVTWSPDPANTLDPITYTPVNGDLVPHADSVSWIFPGGHFITETGVNPTAHTRPGGELVIGETSQVQLTDTQYAPGTVATVVRRMHVYGPPRAGLNYTIPGITGRPVSFFDNSSLTSPWNVYGIPTSWAWDFGDGNTSTLQNPVHTYTSPGVYTVTLTATNAYGSDVATTPYTVTDVPIAGFTFLPDPGLTLAPVDFTDTTANNPTSWAWDFGDGGTDTVQNPAHIYYTPGNYTVTLVATNSNGTDTVTHPITVGALPVAGFSWTSAYPNLSEPTRFTDTSTGVPTSWAWDFGDGGTDTAQNPWHTYGSTGVYTVTLVVTNAYGTDTITHSLTVYPGTPPSTLWYGFPGPDTTPRYPIQTGRPVAFEDSTPQEGPFPNLTYAWDFNSGEEVPASVKVAVRSFKTPGTKHVTETVANVIGPQSASRDLPVIDNPNFVRGLRVDVIPEVTGDVALRNAEAMLHGPILYNGLLWIWVKYASELAFGGTLKAIDPSTGGIVHSIDFPADECQNITRFRMTVGGGSLWLVGDTQRLYQLTGTTLTWYTYPECLGGLKSVAWRPDTGDLWVMGTMTTMFPSSTWELLHVSPTDGSIIHRAVPPSSSLLVQDAQRIQVDFHSSTAITPIFYIFVDGPYWRGGAVSNTMYIFDPVSLGFDDFGVAGGALNLTHEMTPDLTGPGRPYVWNFGTLGTIEKKGDQVYGNAVFEYEGLSILIFWGEWVDDQNYVFFGRDMAINILYANFGNFATSGMGVLGCFNTVLRCPVWMIWDFEWVDPASLNVLGEVDAHSYAAGALTGSVYPVGESDATSSGSGVLTVV